MSLHMLTGCDDDEIGRLFKKKAKGSKPAAKKKSFFKKAGETAKRMTKISTKNKAKINKTFKKAGETAKRMTKISAKNKAKINKTFKKVSKGVKKYNPASLVIRGGIILALRTNFMKLANKLKYSYMTDAAANRRGFDIGELRKLREARANFEKTFAKFGGNASQLRAAILASGRDKSISGLGVAPLAIAAAAIPILTSLAKLLNGAVDFGKLFGDGKKGAEELDAMQPAGEMTVAEAEALEKGYNELERQAEAEGAEGSQAAEDGTTIPGALSSLIGNKTLMIGGVAILGAALLFNRNKK